MSKIISSPRVASGLIAAALAVLPGVAAGSAAAAPASTPDSPLAGVTAPTFKTGTLVCYSDNTVEAGSKEPSRIILSYLGEPAGKDSLGRDFLRLAGLQRTETKVNGVWTQQGLPKVADLSPVPAEGTALQWCQGNYDYLGPVTVSATFIR